MSKSLPKIIIITSLLFSSFMMFNTVFSATADIVDLGTSFTNFNLPIEDDLTVTEFVTTPYEEYTSPKAARTGAQSYVTILAHFSDYTTPRWTKGEHEDIMQTIDDYWVNATYGLMSIDWDVYGWYDLGQNLSDYGHLDGSALDLDVHWHDVMTDAIAVADGDVDFSAYDNIIVMLSEVEWRGWSTLGTKIAITTGEGNFNREGTLVSERIGTPEAAVWGRVAHEMGHCFLLRHTHGSGGTQKNYASYYSLMARAYPSACNVYTQKIDNHADWFDDFGAGEVTIAGGGGGTYHVRPRHLDIAGDIQSLKVEISSTEYYLVEVCEQKSEDAWLPDEGVLIYYVDEGANINDQCTDEDNTPGSAAGLTDLQDCLYDVGDTFTDVANGISIDIDDFALDGFDIIVTNSAGGTPDLMINKWGDPPGSPGPYESIDIHVDSPVNGWNWYRHNDGTGTNPVGNGDEPLLNHENRLHAKISNIGDSDASGVVVKFYENTPIGAGASGTWTLIDTVSGLTIVKGTTQDIYVPWTPTYAVSPTSTGIMDMHSCVKVVIDSHILETNTGNNDGQENIDFFEILQGAPMPGMMSVKAVYGTVSKDFTIVNPSDKYSNDIHINVLGVTDGWIVTGNGIGEYHTFAPGESKDFHIEITPGPDVRMTESITADLVASWDEIYDDDDDTFVGDGHLTPFGGVSIKATLMYGSDLEISAAFREENQFSILGELSYLDEIPQQNMPDAEGDRTVYLIIENKDSGTVQTATVVADMYGKFEHIVTGKTELYAVNAYYSGTGYIASSASVTLMVDLNASTYWTSTASNLFPGFTLTLALSAIVPIGVYVIIQRKKK